jgi:glycosyltransferase involved in cell wall biosynthesis
VSAEVSVVIPAYNAARTIGKTVDTVLAQTFPDFELIVVDDGSKDDTADIVEAVGDSRVTCVRTQNGGVSVARNRGLERASGRYVAFLDADDAWKPAKLERQHAAMKANPDVGVSFPATVVVDDDLRPTAAHEAVHRDDYTAALLLEGNIIAGSASSVMARASLFDEVGGFDPSLSLCADWDMWLRLSAAASFVPIDEPLALYRSIPGTMSSDPAVLERDTFAMFDKFFASPASARYDGIRRRAYGNQWMVCAGSYLHTRDVRDALRCAVAGLRSDPRTMSRLVSFPARWADRARRRIQGRPARHPKALSDRT